MQLVLLDVDGVLGLHGKVVFRPGRPTILYGENLSGKTNMITVLRLCFLRKSIFRSKDVKLEKSEILLDPLDEGDVACYFLQNGKLYRLAYQFSKTGSKTEEERQLFEADGIVIEWADSAEEISKRLEDISWGDPIAQTIRELEESLEEIGVFPEVMDLLFASRNVDSYLKALEGEICEIPEALSEALMDVKDEAQKNQKRLDKVESVLLKLRERAEKCLGEQPEYLEEVLPEEGLEGVSTSNVEDVHERIDKWEKEVNERLSEGIPEDVQTAKDAQNDLEEEKPKVEAIDSAREEILEEEENFESHIRKREKLNSASDSWRRIVKDLKIPVKAWNMDSAVVPEVEGFDFEIFDDGEEVKSLFSTLDECKKELEGVKGIASKFDLGSSDDLKKETKNVGELLRTLENPENPPEEATDALLTPPPSGGKYPVVSIPVNRYKEGMEKVNRTPRVHREEEMTEEEKEELKERRERLEGKVEDLSEAKEKFENAEGMFEEIEDDKSLPDDKQDELKDRAEEIKENIEDLRDDFQASASVLYNRFDRGEFDLDFKPKTYEDDFPELSKAVEDCTKGVKEEITGILDELPKSIVVKFSKTEEKLREKVALETITNAIDELEKIIGDLEEERERQKEIRDWLQGEKSKVQKFLKDFSYTEYLLTNLLPFPRALYRIADEKVDLDKMIDDLGNYIQENVEHSYRSIIPDETLEFIHIGGGEFEPALEGQYISNPSGSQRAAISFGIMYTLASQLNLPLVMDEAADRFDTYRLSDFLSLAQKVAEEDENVQICLTIYETRDVSDHELKKANTYEVQGDSYSQKTIEPYAGGQG